MSLRSSLLTCSLLLLVVANAQTLVPYVTRADRFGVFVEGRFDELAPRKPNAVYPNGTRLMYITPEGELWARMDDRNVPLQRGERVDVKTSRGQFAWKQGEALRVPTEDGGFTICHDAGEFSVRDSLVAFHNEMDRALCVYWRNRTFTVADLLLATEAPQWQAGANTLVYYVRDQRKVLLFYRGEVIDLYSGADYAQVSAGGDVVAYMDDGDDVFRVFDRGERIDLEDMRPVNFSAGLGLVGYVSGTGKFRCYDGRSVITLSNDAPTAYYVQDSVITWVDNGEWKTLNAGRVEVIERYVPENWQVSGGSIAYQDLNRELRIYHRGERITVTEEAGVKRFELHGDAVVWQSNSGTTRVWWKGKVYDRY